MAYPFALTKIKLAFLALAANAGTQIKRNI